MPVRPGCRPGRGPSGPAFGRPRPGARSGTLGTRACWSNATTGVSHSGDRGTAARGGDAGEREGRGGGDETVEVLTPEVMVRTEGHGADGRRRYRASTAADGGEVTALDLAT